MRPMSESLDGIGERGAEVGEEGDQSLPKRVVIEDDKQNEIIIH